MSSTQDFWPPIEEAININNDPLSTNSTSHVQCPICLEAIAVTSFPPVPEREADILGTDPTLGEILLCGHVLCQSCRVQSEEASNPWEARKCPMCRTSLQCIDCGKRSQVVPIPKEGPASSVPAILTGGSRCRDCKAVAGFDEEVQRGEWPEGLTDMEPGFVPLFYHLVTKMQQQDMIICKRSIINAFSTIVDEEFGQMVTKRSDRVHEMRAALEGESPWFEEEDSSEDEDDHLLSLAPAVPDYPWNQRPAERPNVENGLTGSGVATPVPRVHWSDTLDEDPAESTTSLEEESEPPAPDAATQETIRGFLGSLAARPTPRAGLRNLFGPRSQVWPHPLEIPNLRIVTFETSPLRPEDIMRDLQENFDRARMHAANRNAAATTSVDDELADERNNDWQPFGFYPEVVDVHVDSNGNDDGEHRSIDDTSSEDNDGSSRNYDVDSGSSNDSSLALSVDEDEDVEMII
ncbi:hypothetical protein FPOAC2_10512 [Fusarium poae]|uniref:hypothetical protein n=1 Tax=Fusarium poae TaxID=36050 RepID=UPI001CEA8DC9|nr:hypothetical protein FPOAC1_010237 [Fusarium poae]KAG8665441.1 hypothetical protein FPOAC1_010237 [Fusarium poae]